MNNYEKYQRPYLKRLKKRLLDYYGNKCCICGATENLEFAHKKSTKIKGVRRGKSERLLDILKNLDCYSLTCKKHNKNVEVVVNDITKRQQKRLGKKWRELLNGQKREKS